MNTIEIIREFKTKNFTVRVAAVEDCDVDTSFDETGETLEKLCSGELQAFGVVVNVFFQGHKLSEDSLWNCIYKTPEDFMDHKGLRAKSLKDGCNYGSYFCDMIRRAISEARDQADAMRKIPVRKLSK